MKVHKRSKRTRLRGSRSAGTGFRKKKKGHGNNGGHGWSGTGKRGSQKQQKALMFAREAGFESYFGKQGFTSASTQKKRTEQINLRDVKANLFEKDGQKTEPSKSVQSLPVIELKEHKILGDGEGFKAEIHAASASASAIEKMAQAGGKIILPEQKEASTKSTHVSQNEKVSSEKKVEEKAVEKSEGKKAVAKKTVAKK